MLRMRKDFSKQPSAIQTQSFFLSTKLFIASVFSAQGQKLALKNFYLLDKLTSFDQAPMRLLSLGA